jgi:hypothetical protein
VPQTHPPSDWKPFADGDYTAGARLPRRKDGPPPAAAIKPVPREQVNLRIVVIFGILAVMAKTDEDQFSELKEALASLGPIRRGTVLRRFMPCGKPGCRCRADPPKLHGPYYEWTRKVSGKTVSVRLSEQQAGLMGQWIANARHLDQIVAEIERVSLRLTEPLLQSAAKPRKDRKA